MSSARIRCHQTCAGLGVARTPGTHFLPLKHIPSSGGVPLGAPCTPCLANRVPTAYTSCPMRDPGAQRCPCPCGRPGRRRSRTPCLAHRVPLRSLLRTSRCPMRDPGVTQRCPLRSSNAGWWAGSRRGSRCDSCPLKSDLSSVLRARTRRRQSAQARRSRQRRSPLRPRGPSNHPSRCFPRRQMPWSCHFCNT